MKKGDSKTFCIFSAQYLPHIGGVEVFTKNLANALISNGDDVVIVTNDLEGLPSCEHLEEGIEIFRLPCHPFLNGRFPVPKKNYEYKALMDKIASIPMDGIIINTRFYMHTLEALKLAKMVGCKAIIIDHGSDYLTFGNSFLDVFVKLYEHVVTFLTKRYHPDYYGISKASLGWLRTFGIEGSGVISNAIDVELFKEGASSKSFRDSLSISDDQLIITYTGRLIPEKGIDRLIDCARQLDGEEDVQFLVAGDGPMRSVIENAEGANLHYLGKLDMSEISRLMQESDIFCFPSRSEGFGGSLLEAAVCGNVIISTNVGIAEDLIPSKEYGVLLQDMPSGKDLVAAIESLYRDPIRRNAMAHHSENRASILFNWDNTVNQVHEAFNKND